MIKAKNFHTINLLVTLDRNYVPQLNVMLFSALCSDSSAYFCVYILHDNGLADTDLITTNAILGQRGELHLIKVNDCGLTDAPTSDRYPKAIYYRIFAAKYLPAKLERVLYLDPDIVVRKSLQELYELPIDTAYFAAASHIRTLLHRFNELRLGMGEDSPYINSGVMLMNLQALRAEQDTQEVFNYMEAHKGRLLLPDQDIISALYGQRILPLDAVRYNMTETYHAAYNYRDELEPKFYSDASSFQVTLYNLNYGTATNTTNVTIESENVAIEVAIDRLNASQGTIAKAKAVFANMGIDGMFGRSDIAVITKDSVTAAGNLITKLKDADLIESVSGFGKGKYKFKIPKE